MKQFNLSDKLLQLKSSGECASIFCFAHRMQEKRTTKKVESSEKDKPR
jgi:hypothetical protein